MNITIPDNIIQGTNLNEKDLEIDLALWLYKQNKISSGKIRAWLDLTVLEFQ